MLSQHLLDDKLCLQLLPRMAYSARDPVRWHSLGITLERQRGVHAIDSDRRADFDTFAGVLAQTPVGVEVFSESARGGEYLVLRLEAALAQQLLPVTAQRVQAGGQRQALQQAMGLRRLLLACETDRLALEEAAMAFLAQARAPEVQPKVQPKAFVRVLDQIGDEHHLPLSLDQLANTYGHNALRFLRDFTQAIGLTPHAYLVQVRLQAARHLIEHTDQDLATLALEAGFAHQSHMGSAFRKHLGMTPGQYRLRAGLMAGKPAPAGPPRL